MTKKIIFLFVLCCVLSSTTLVVAQVDITNSPGTISAEYTDSPAGEDIAKLIDNSSTTKYLTFHSAGWVQFRSNTSSVATRYSLTSANDAAERDPLNWTLQGSNNGTSWATLDTRSNEDFPNRFQRKEYSFSNATAYTYFRLQMNNNTGTILQLAELEIFGVVSTPTVATIYQHCSYGGYAVALSVGTYSLATLQSKGMVNNDVSSVRVTSGYKITFYDTDNATGATVSKTADDDCLVNDSFNDRATSIKVEQNTTDDWGTFTMPEVVFQNLSPTHPGAVIFNRAIPDAPGTMREIILLLVKKIYSSPSDNMRLFTKLTLMIEDYDGVAEAWGGTNDRNIRVSTRHIQNVYNANGNDEAIRVEIRGILAHEGTHAYQHEPKNAGEYDGNSEFFGFIEGLADYVRISLGLHPTRSPQTGGSWTNGYTTSGFFLNWIVNTKGDPNFAIKFNRTAGTYSTWSWDIACRDILGIGVQTLWNEYQAWINSQRVAMSSIAVTPYALEIQKGCTHTTQKYNTATLTKPVVGYPNPARNVININLNGSDQDKAEVSFISDSVKKKVLVSGKAATVNIEDLKPGVYLMIIKDSKGNVTKQRILIN